MDVCILNDTMTATLCGKANTPALRASGATFLTGEGYDALQTTVHGYTWMPICKSCVHAIG